MKKQESVPTEIKKTFDKEAFKKEVVTNVKLLFRKTIGRSQRTGGFSGGITCC